jgi:hypothetical protein
MTDDKWQMLLLKPIAGLTCRSVAFTLPISEFLVISPVLGYGIYFGLMGWSFWYGNQRRKAGERLAALAAKSVTFGIPRAANPLL